MGVKCACSAAAGSRQATAASPSAARSVERESILLSVVCRSGSNARPLVLTSCLPFLIPPAALGLSALPKRLVGPRVASRHCSQADGCLRESARHPYLPRAGADQFARSSVYIQADIWK